MLRKNPALFASGFLLIVGGTCALSQTTSQNESPKQNRTLSQTLAEKQALFQKFKEGTQALREKEYEHAIESLTSASQLDPNQGVIWASLAESLLGFSRSKTGSEHDQAVDQAVSAYAKAVNLIPDDATFRHGYSRALANARKFEESVNEIANAIRLDPSRAGSFYFTTGAVELGANLTDQALAIFKASMDAGNPEAYYQVGVLLLSKAVVDPIRGKVTPAPGTIDAFQGYLRLAPGGHWTEQVCKILVMMKEIDGTVCGSPLAQAPKAVPLAKSAPVARPSLNSVRQEIERVYLSGSYSDLPTIHAISPSLRTEDQAGLKSSILDIKNGTSFSLTTLLTGVTDYRVEIGPGQSMSIELAPGTYRMVSKIDAPGVQPSYGEHVFHSGRSAMEFRAQ